MWLHCAGRELGFWLGCGRLRPDLWGAARYVLGSFTKTDRKGQSAVGWVNLGPRERIGLRVSLWESSVGDILKAWVLEEAGQSRPWGLPLSA